MPDEIKCPRTPQPKKKDNMNLDDRIYLLLALFLIDFFDSQIDYS